MINSMVQVDDKFLKRAIIDKIGLSYKKDSCIIFTLFTILKCFTNMRGLPTKKDIGLLKALRNKLLSFYGAAMQKKKKKASLKIAGYNSRPFLKLKIKRHTYGFYLNCSLYAHSKSGTQHYFPPASLVVLNDGDWNKTLVVASVYDIDKKIDRDNFKGYKFAKGFSKLFVTDGRLSSIDEDFILKNGFDILDINHPEAVESIESRLQSFIEPLGK